MNNSDNFSKYSRLQFVISHLVGMALTLNCFPDVSLWGLFPAWVQSFGFCRSDEDSLQNGRTEPEPIKNRGRMIPDARIPYAHTEVAVYPPTSHTVGGLHNSRESKIFIERGASQAGEIRGK